MMSTDFKRSVFSFLLKVFMVSLLIAGVFSIICLRSSFVKLEYRLGTLEQKKVECLKERKMLLAQKTSLLSLEKLEASLNTTEEFILPDRIKVIHVDKKKQYLPKRASLERRQLAEP